MLNLYTLIIGSLPLLIQLYSEKYRKDNLALTLTELQNDDNLPRIKIYDFIVVGGGGAGCVIANRLSKYYNVLLLEAGGTPPPATRVPSFYDSVSTDPSINYIYNSIPQKYASLDYGGNLQKVYGKMLGGSTSHNGFIYNRGNPLDYDNWATITNDTSWKYKNILKYFKISENYIGEESQNTEEKQHGYFGLLTVETVDVPILASWLDAGAQLGYKTTLDPNGPQIESFSAVATTTKTGQRVSTYTAFIEPFEKIRKKLHIQRYSEVSQVLIDDRHKRAYGVAYKRHGIPQIAHSSKEVIISCGAIGTALLLIKSGIGPSSTLKDAKIQLIKDLPVGNTLVDQSYVDIGPFYFTESSKLNSPEFEWNEKSLTEYHNEKHGIITQLGFEGQAFIVSSRAKKESQSTWPDIQLTVTSGDPLSNPLSNVMVLVTRPKSIGTVRLNTTAYTSGITNDEELALIDYNILSDPSDADVLLEGIKHALNTFENTNAFQKLGANFTTVKLPSCNKYQLRSDEYWYCFIRQTGTSGMHPTGTCKMGFGEKDKKAVVDSKLNVLGVSNLKVVDTSVMPMISNANIQAPTIMIAEKASKEILKAWKTRA